MKVYRCIGMLALVVAVMGLAASSSVIEAGECGKKSVIVPQAIQGEGPLVATICRSATKEQREIAQTCFEQYWVIPAHNVCEDGDNDWCCKITVRKARLWAGACVVGTNEVGVCTYGAGADPGPFQIAPYYYPATLLPCDDGVAHKDCGKASADG